MNSAQNVAECRILNGGYSPKTESIPAATLRHAFDKAVKDAKIEVLQFRDFRHCARTRWAAAGLPFEVAEIGMGHKIRGIAGRYVNLCDDHIREAFGEMFRKIPVASDEQKKESQQH